MWSGTSRQLDTITVGNVPLLSTVITVVNVGVIMASQLSMDTHVVALCRNGYYQIRQLRPVARSLSDNAAKTLVYALLYPAGWTIAMDYRMTCL